MNVDTSAAIDRFSSFLGNSWVGGVIRATGLEQPLSTAKERLMYALAEEYFTLSVDGHSARYHLDNYEQYAGFRTQSKERKIMSDLLNHLQPNDVFWDVGAQRGVYTCLVAARRPDSTVVAFEPNEENVRQLEANVELNDVDVQVVSFGLSDGDRDGELITEDGAERLATDQTAMETVPIRLTSGDSLVDSGTVPQPNVLKIDVEGAECSVLRGLQETLEAPACRVVYCEIHPEEIERHFGESVSYVYELLEKAGFACEDVFARGRQPYVCATK